jgi:hypothetical protein
MFVYVPVLRPKGFSRVKTAARFTAEDPWHPGRRGNFTVDEYVPTMTNNQAVANTTREWRWFVGFYRALNYDSHPSGPRRFLPDSLVELWRTDQIRTVDLPRLLRAIEPTLKDQDARPLLRDRRLKFFVWPRHSVASLSSIASRQVVTLRAQAQSLSVEIRRPRRSPSQGGGAGVSPMAPSMVFVSKWSRASAGAQTEARRHRRHEVHTSMVAKRHANTSGR